MDDLGFAVIPQEDDDLEKSADTVYAQPEFTLRILVVKRARNEGIPCCGLRILVRNAVLARGRMNDQASTHC